MASDRQTTANRENAQKSTGPTTAEGKARSCMNHLTTGIDAQSAIIHGENPADRQALSDRYFIRYKPANDDERHQVDIMVYCDWLSLRLMRAETQTWCQAMEGPIRRHDPNSVGEAYGNCQITLSRLDSRRERNERMYNRARHELEQIQAARFAAEALELQAEVELAPEPAPAPPQPAETAPPAEELGSKLGNAPAAASTPKFGPQPDSGPLATPKEEPPKVA